MALCGRHQGLPVAIDKAVMLPGDSLTWAEEVDRALRRERTGSELNASLGVFTFVLTRFENRASRLWNW